MIIDYVIFKYWSRYRRAFCTYITASD